MESPFFSLIYILGTTTVCTVFLWYGSRFERNRHSRDGRLRHGESQEHRGHAPVPRGEEHPP
jgi:hypothetical protein